MRAELDSFIEAEHGPRGRVYAYTDKPVYFIETEDGRRDVVVESKIARVVTHWQDAMHGECDCVPDVGPSHCHRCGEERGGPVPYTEAPCKPRITLGDLDGTDDAADWITAGHVLDEHEVAFLRALPIRGAR